MDNTNIGRRPDLTPPPSVPDREQLGCVRVWVAVACLVVRTVHAGCDSRKRSQGRRVFKPPSACTAQHLSGFPFGTR